MNKSLRKFALASFKKPGRALDLGAGDFSDVTNLERMGWECEGVDINMGVDLEVSYKSKKGPFDLVYSNYVINKLNNKKQLIKTAYDNLKKGGWFFIHTFDASDKSSRKNISNKMSQLELVGLLTDQKFKNISSKVFNYYDNDLGHKHWHRILEATAQK